MLPLVSVVVANWNGRPYLERCLASLVTQTYPAVEIIVVDNGSTDGSVAWLAESYPAVAVIPNTENRGFAAASNQGIAQARGAYVVLLNNDAWAEPQWLAALVAAAESDARVGMVASLMLLADRPEVVDSAGICVDRCGISWDRAGGLSAAYRGLLSLAVFGPSAGAGLYRRELFEDVGGFDEDFFAYLEDVDLAWRARRRGWQVAYAPAARVYHVHSGTSRPGSALKTFWLARNKIELIVKNYPLPHLWFYLPLILLYDGISLGAALLGPQRWSALSGRLAGWRVGPRAWRKRRILGTPALSSGAMHRLLAPSAWPWQVARRYQHRDVGRSAAGRRPSAAR